MLIDSRVVERRANTVGISLRSGCHCNPGAGEVALGFSREEMAGPFAYRDRLSYEEFLRVIDGKKTGAARVSVGLVSTFADVHRFVEFVATFRDAPSPGAPTCGAGGTSGHALVTWGEGAADPLPPTRP